MRVLSQFAVGFVFVFSASFVHLGPAIWELAVQQLELQKISQIGQLWSRKICEAFGRWAGTFSFGGGGFPSKKNTKNQTTNYKTCCEKASKFAGTSQGSVNLSNKKTPHMEWPIFLLSYWGACQGHHRLGTPEGSGVKGMRCSAVWDHHRAGCIWMGWDGKGHVETATSTCSQISRKAQMGDAGLKKPPWLFSKKGRQKGQVSR